MIVIEMLMTEKQAKLQNATPCSCRSILKVGLLEKERKKKSLKFSKGSTLFKHQLLIFLKERRQGTVHQVSKCQPEPSLLAPGQLKG